MKDRIDKDTIKKAIDKLQADHPCHFAYNHTSFGSIEDVNAISHAVDMVALRMQKDSEINIICELAKLYLEGVRPTIEHKQSEWTAEGNCKNCGEHAPFWCMASTYHTTPFCYNCGAKMSNYLDTSEEGDEE